MPGQHMDLFRDRMRSNSHLTQRETAHPWPTHLGWTDLTTKGTGLLGSATNSKRLRNHVRQWGLVRPRPAKVVPEIASFLPRLFAQGEACQPLRV